MDQINRIRRNYEIWIFSSIAIACLGVLQFSVCVWLAMAYHPDGFSLSTHLLTDLGKDAYDWGFVFNGSVMILGLCLIPIFVLLPFVETRNSYSKYVVSVSGVCSGLGLVLLGLTPNDIYFFEHYAALFLWAMPTIATIMAFFYLVSNNPNMSMWFIATCLLTVVGVLAFLSGSQETNRLVLQKILLAYAFVWFGFLAFFSYRCGRLALDNAMLDHVSKENLAEQYRYQLMSNDHRK